jgi:hypothetical protein
MDVFEWNNAKNVGYTRRVTNFEQLHNKHFELV